MTRLFVYGTLRPSLGHHAARMLAPAIVSAARASVRGRLHHLGRYPGLEVGEGCDGRVRGEVVTLRAGADVALLRRLDSYEGPEYVRVELDALLDDGATLRTWAWVLHTVPARARPIDGGDWAPHASADRPAP